VSHRIGILSATLAAAMLALLAGTVAREATGAAQPAAAAPAEDKPELDLVVRTGVRFHPNHTRMVQDSLVSQVYDCLKGLVSDTAAGSTPPKDGAARYRLFVQHAAAIKINKGVRRIRLERDDHFAARFVTADESGRYQFRLVKWNGSSYEKVDQWQVPYGKRHWLALPKDTNTRKAAEMVPQMMLGAEPTSVRAALLSYLLPIKVVRTTGTAGQTQTCQVAVANRSPWKLSKLDVYMQWPDARSPQNARYKASFRLPEPLAPGDKTSVTCTGEPLTLQFGFQYSEPMEMRPSATWEPVETQ